MGGAESVCRCVSKLFSGAGKVKVTFAETGIAALTEHILQFA